MGFHPRNRLARKRRHLKPIDVSEMKLGKSDEVAIECSDEKIALSADGKEIYVSDISQSKAVLENEAKRLAMI